MNQPSTTPHQIAAWLTAEGHAMSPIKVLIVDDTREIRTLIRRVLTDVGAVEVSGEAEDGESAVQQALALRPHLVVMDVQMPRLDGVEATRRIRELLPDTVIIGFSVRLDEDTQHRMRAAGAARILPKERALELPSAIQAVMQHRPTASHPSPD